MFCYEIRVPPQALTFSVHMYVIIINDGMIVPLDSFYDFSNLFF